MKCCLISLGACLFSACFNTCKSNTNDISISTRRPTSCQRPTVLSLCLNSFARCSFLFIPALLILNIMIFCISPENPDIVIVHFPEDYFESTRLLCSLHIFSIFTKFLMIFVVIYFILWKAIRNRLFSMQSQFSNIWTTELMLFYSTFKTFNRLDTIHFK